MDDVFKNRKKGYTGETVEGVWKKILIHRRDVHGSYDPKIFYDCATCGALEHRYDTLESLRAKDQHGTNPRP